MARGLEYGEQQVLVLPPYGWPTDPKVLAVLRGTRHPRHLLSSPSSICLFRRWFHILFSFFVEFARSAYAHPGTRGRCWLGAGLRTLARTSPVRRQYQHRVSKALQLLIVAVVVSDKPPCGKKAKERRVETELICLGCRKKKTICTYTHTMVYDGHFAPFLDAWHKS